LTAINYLIRTLGYLLIAVLISIAGFIFIAWVTITTALFYHEGFETIIDDAKEIMNGN
jgi:hypothetical protein